MIDLGKNGFRLDTVCVFQQNVMSCLIPSSKADVVSPSGTNILRVSKMTTE